VNRRAACVSCRRRKQRKAAEATAVKLRATPSGSDVTRACDRRRLTGSALGYFEPATSPSDVIEYSDDSSTSSSRDVTSWSSAAPRHDASPDDPQQRLHRSSPLTALNSIYVIDDHVTCHGGGGAVNAGFVGDGVLTDSWRRVSWRARLRAGIARSTASSDPGPPTARRGAACARRPSYLSDVIDSVTFFSDAGQAGARARRELPLTDVPVMVARCRSDGGDWTLRSDRERGHRPSSLQVSSGQRRSDHTRRPDTYYTYVRPTRDAVAV